VLLEPMRRSEVLPYRAPRVVDDLGLRRIGRAMSADHPAPRPRDLDPESAEWVRSLSSGVSGHDEAVGRLHAMLVRAESRRRSSQLAISGPELEDLAHQAAADALVAILAKVAQFRSDSQFTTWAYKFVIFEVSTKFSRHFWRSRDVKLEGEDWDRLPDRFGFAPEQFSERRELIGAVRQAVDSTLTEHQRRVFVAIVLKGVPLDVLVEELGSNRNAIYKTMFDARSKLRGFLVANRYLEGDGTWRR
jgi:RNA polymerase sigma-70 factor, ECF subfamily